MNELRLPNADVQKSIDDRLERIETGSSILSTNIVGAVMDGSISAKSKNGVDDIPLTAEIDNEGNGVLRVVDVGGIAYDNHADATKIIPANKIEFESLHKGEVTGELKLTDIDSRGADSMWVWVSTSAPNWTLKCGLDKVGIMEGSSVSEDGVYPPMVAVSSNTPLHYRKRGLLVLDKSESLQDAIINRLQLPCRITFVNLSGTPMNVDILIERKWSA